MPNAKSTDKDYWKETILAINDAKILSYIQELCRTRLDIGNADKKMDGERPFNSYDYGMPSVPSIKGEKEAKPSPKLEPIMKMKSEAEENEY